MKRILRLSRSAISEARSRFTELVRWSSNMGCQGQDLVEYALMAGFVAVAVAAFIPYSVMGPITTIFTKIGNYLVIKGNG
jgi:Flp pilus assembly pilin Flp